jgi:hypothetical protein
MLFVQIDDLREIRTLNFNLNLLYMKSNLLYFAMFLIVLSIPFRGSANEVRWLWEDLPWIPFALMLASLICIALYVYKKELIKRG